MEKALKSLFSLAILGVIGLFIFSTCNRPEPSNALINDSVTETISEAAKKGYKPCDNPRCLNYSKKGWHHMRTPNYPDSYIWLSYGSMSYSQAHIGHLIDSSSGKPLDVGPCPTCDGSGWIEKKVPSKRK